MEEKLGLGGGFRPKSPNQVDTERAFKEALAACDFSVERQGQLEEVFAAAKDVLEEPEVNSRGREVLRRGLRVALLKQRGVTQERLKREEAMLKRACDRLGSTLVPHLSQVPSSEELADIALQLALAIQRLKKIPKKADEGQKGGKPRVLLQELVPLKDQAGRAKAGCLVRILILAVLLCPSLGGSLEILDQVLARAGERVIVNRFTPEERRLYQLRQDDLGHLLTAVGTGQIDLEEKIYFQVVWGIRLEELRRWKEAHPEISSKGLLNYLKQLLDRKEPSYRGGYEDWLETQWPNLQQKTPRPTPRPQAKTKGPKGFRGFQDARSKVEVGRRRNPRV